MKFNRPERDFRGFKLCDPCWNGMHWHREVDMETGREKGRKISDCLRGDCECHCWELMNERHPKVKRDYSQQMSIDVEPINIGDKHRDE